MRRLLYHATEIPLHRSNFDEVQQFEQMPNWFARTAVDFSRMFARFGVQMTAQSTPASRCALRCARDGAEAVDLVAKLTRKRRRRTKETLGEAGDKDWGLKRG